MSSDRAAALPSLKGFSMSLTSKTYSSPFNPAVARMCGFSGLNCNALIAPVCLFVCEMRASDAPASSFAASYSSREPFSRAPAMTPLGWLESAGPQAMSKNLSQCQFSVSPQFRIQMGSHVYLDSVEMLVSGCSSNPCCVSSRQRSHSSNLLSSEKSASTAPARVPVTSKGFPGPGDQAKVAVRGTSRRRTMMAGV